MHPSTVRYHSMETAYEELLGKRVLNLQLSFILIAEKIKFNSCQVS